MYLTKKEGKDYNFVDWTLQYNTVYLSMAEEAPISPEKPQTQDNTNSQQPTSDNPNPQPDQPDPSQIPNPNLTLPPPPLPYAPPSFRPAAPPVPLPMPPQFSPMPNSSFQPQNHGVQPPGVGPGPGSGSVSVPGGLVYPQQMMRPSYMQMPNGYLPMPPPGGFLPLFSFICTQKNYTYIN